MAAKVAKSTTLADLMAAAKVGAIDPSTEVVEVSAVRSMMDRAAKDAAKAAVVATDGGVGAVVSATEHDCAIPGCKHGAAHPEHSQPDRQVKMQCPGCGAVARMTQRAIASTQGRGIVCGGDGATFTIAARRTYSRRAQ